MKMLPLDNMPSYVTDLLGYLIFHLWGEFFPRPINKIKKFEVLLDREINNKQNGKNDNFSIYTLMPEKT